VNSQGGTAQVFGCKLDVLISVPGDLHDKRGVQCREVIVVWLAQARGNSSGEAPVHGGLGEGGVEMV